MGKTSRDRDLKGLTALYPVIGVEAPAETAAAFRRHFGLEPVFETDWFVQLKRPGTGLELGLVRFDHESVPVHARRSIDGAAAFVTIDAADVAAVWHEIGREVEAILPLRDEPWGQRHFICCLPGGVMVDIVQQLSG